LTFVVVVDDAEGVGGVDDVDLLVSYQRKFPGLKILLVF